MTAAEPPVLRFADQAEFGAWLKENEETPAQLVHRRQAAHRAARRLANQHGSAPDELALAFNTSNLEPLV